MLFALPLVLSLLAYDLLKLSSGLGGLTRSTGFALLPATFALLVLMPDGLLPVTIGVLECCGYGYPRLSGDISLVGRLLRSAESPESCRLGGTSGRDRGCTGTVLPAVRKNSSHVCSSSVPANGELGGPLMLRLWCRVLSTVGCFVATT